MPSAPFISQYLCSPVATGCDGVHFPVHGGWNLMVQVFDFFMYGISFWLIVRFVLQENGNNKTRMFPFSF